MKRLLLLALIFSLAHAPVAFADGPLVASAKRAAQELAQADVQPVNLSDAGARQRAWPDGWLGRHGGPRGGCPRRGLGDEHHHEDVARDRHRRAPCRHVLDH